MNTVFNDDCKMSLSLKALHYRSFNFINKVLNSCTPYLSAISNTHISNFLIFAFDFDWLRGRQHGLMVGCIFGSLAFNIAISFHLFHETGNAVQYSLYSCS